MCPSQIGFRFSEPDFTRTLDLSQSQNPRLRFAKPLVLFNQKIKISGKLLLLTDRLCQGPALKSLKLLRNGIVKYIVSFQKSKKINDGFIELTFEE